MPQPSPAQSLQTEYVQAARSLAARLAALAEVDMRLAAFAEALSNMGAVQGVWTLDTVIRGALAKSPECVAVYSGLVEVAPLARQLGNERLDALYQAGCAEGSVAALHWLAAHGEDPLLRANSDALVHPDFREMTLGGRRALARRAQGDLMQRLAGDPDPGVIANLLANRRTTEQVVLDICSRRPTVSDALVAVLRSPRWSTRYRLRLALAKNPYLAPRVAANLLVCLNRPDLKSVRDDERLAPSLRLAAQRLIDLKRG